jgi:outer membrane receptor protein involved in Fe transport
MKHLPLSFLLLLFLLSSIALHAQSPSGGSVKGTVVDRSSSRGLEFVNVSLLSLPDSAVVTGTVTGKGGAFEIDKLKEGAYICRFSLMGYRSALSKRIGITPAQRAVAIGSVALDEAPVTLDEVVVTKEKLLQNNAIDRKVYNVGQDIAAKSGSASDVLQNVPSVEVDVEGNVSLRGSGNVLILINGKNSPLMGQNRATVLQQLPANALERIEVITNPSAKYKPDGTSGIINLVLKKNTDLGLNGSLAANAGNKDRYNGTARLNWKPERFNLFGSYSVRRDARTRVSTDTRSEGATAPAPGSYQEDLASNARPLAHIATFGAELEIESVGSMGVSGDIFRNSFVRSDRSVKTFRGLTGTLTALQRRERWDGEYENEAGYTTFFEHVFDGEEHKIRAEFSGSHQDEEEDNHYTNYSDVPAGPVTFDNSLIRQIDDQKRVSVDYTNPLSETSKLEAGYAGDFNANDATYSIENYDAEQLRFVVDATKSNTFRFREALHAEYATYEQSLGLFGFMAGLRAEQALVQSHLVTLDTTIDHSYVALFPTLHLSYKLGEESELQLNYSRRTNRPDGGDLNPFPEYRDPKTVFAGNPKLLPEYVNSVEFGAKYQASTFSLIPSLYYRFTYNRFTMVTSMRTDSSLWTTWQNLEKDQSAGLEVILSANGNETFSAHASGNVFYNQIDASNLGYSANKSIVSWRGALTCSVHATSSTMLQLSANYNSVRLTPQGESAPSYVVNLGARQELFDGKLTATLAASDIFHTMKRESRIDTPDLTQTVINTRDSRVVYLGLTYVFGTPPKRKDDALKYDEGM